MAGTVLPQARPIRSTHARRPPPPTLFPYTTLFRSPPDREAQPAAGIGPGQDHRQQGSGEEGAHPSVGAVVGPRWVGADRKSTRLNSSHVAISYAVFCLKKKKGYTRRTTAATGPCDGGRAHGRYRTPTGAPHSFYPRTAPPATHPLSLHDALPISPGP